jgi:acyl carrier protein
MPEIGGSSLHSTAPYGLSVQKDNSMSRAISRGIEVLVLKAAIDPDFKQLLLERRTAAAEAIGLDLTAAEATMLAAVPAAQLEAVIARTSVPQEHRRAFLGHAAAAMLAALGAAVALPVHAQEVINVAGLLVLPPQENTDPPKKEKTVEERVIEIIADQTGTEAKKIKRGDKLVKDLGAEPADLAEIRKDVAKKFGLKVTAADFKDIGSVGETIDYVEKALKKKPVAPLPPAPQFRAVAGIIAPNN